MDKYVIDKVIGEGTYGIVYRATEKGTNDEVAIKKFRTTDDEQLSKREIQACSMLSHSYIVSYRNSFRHDGLLHLVFDFVPNSMNKLLSCNRRGINPAYAQRLTYQLCLALQYCHSNRVIHRDVKPDNILIDENGDIRLCDFGVARPVQFEGDPLSDYVATRWYRPPEQELRMDRYSFDADIWSVGCVLMELLTGRPLFPGNTQIDQINLIQEYLGPLPPAMAARLPRGVNTVTSASKSFADLLHERELPAGTLDFVIQTMQLEPQQRLSACSCLRHPFLRPLNDIDVQKKKHRQREAKQRLSNSLDDSNDLDDGIEEELPRDATALPRAEAKPQPSVSIRVGDSGAKVSMSPPSDSKQRRQQQLRESKAQTQRYRGENNLSEAGHGDDGSDSDDGIQEIIEVNELSLVEPVSPLRASKRLHSGSARAKNGRRRRADSESGNPLDHECYEDDFEDYHH